MATSDTSWPLAAAEDEPGLWTADHPASARFIVHVLRALYGIDAEVAHGIGTVHIPIGEDSDRYGGAGSVFLADRYGNHPTTGHPWGMRVGRCYHDGRDEIDLWTDNDCTDLSTGIAQLITAVRCLGQPAVGRNGSQPAAVSAESALVDAQAPAPDRPELEPPAAVIAARATAPGCERAADGPRTAGVAEFWNDHSCLDRARVTAFLQMKALDGDPIRGGRAAATAFVAAYLDRIAAHDAATDRGEPSTEPDLDDMWTTWLTTGQL